MVFSQFQGGGTRNAIELSDQSALHLGKLQGTRLTVWTQTQVCRHLGGRIAIYVHQQGIVIQLGRRYAVHGHILSLLP